MNLCGIYCIENIESNKKYVGKSKDIKTRKRVHFQKLNSNIHYNTHLQHSYNKYGKDCFIFYVLELVDYKLLEEKEQYYIEKLNTKSPNGYNLTDGGDGGLGMTDESKHKISIAHLGKQVGQSTRDKLSTIQKLAWKLNPRIVSTETKNKISKSLLGNKYSVNKPNRQGTKPKNRSGFVGVRFTKDNKWEARITFNKKQISLGRYDTDKQAASVYNTYAKKYYGHNAKINNI